MATVNEIKERITQVTNSFQGGRIELNFFERKIASLKKELMKAEKDLASAAPAEPTPAPIEPTEAPSGAPTTKSDAEEPTEDKSKSVAEEPTEDKTSADLEVDIDGTTHTFKKDSLCGINLTTISEGKDLFEFADACTDNLNDCKTALLGLGLTLNDDGDVTC